MDAIVFNSAIEQIVDFIEVVLGPRGFILREHPGLQEDSGDLVSTESMTLMADHLEHPLEIRFFLCCGKNRNTDALRVQALWQGGTQNLVDFSKLSQLQGGSLAHLDFNEEQHPTLDFVGTYLAALSEEFETLWLALLHLQETDSGPAETQAPLPLDFASLLRE